MKSLITCLICILINLASFSQSGWFVRPNFTYNKVSLKNDEDNVAPILFEQKSYSANYGFDIGFQFTDQKAGLASINSGFYFYPVQIDYIGDLKAVNQGSFKTKSELTLNYFKLPISLNFALLKQKRVTPFASIGFSVLRLLNYNDYTIAYIPDNPQRDRVLIVNNNLYYRKDGNFEEFADLSDWYYSKWIIEVNSSIGLKININKRWNIFTMLNASASINDIENKVPITHSFNGYGTLTFNPYEKTRGKIWEQRYIGPTAPARGISRNIIIGVQIGVSYLFIKGFRVLLN